MNKEGKQVLKPIPIAYYLLIITFSLLPFNLSALDFSLRPKGFVSIPLGRGNESAVGTELYNVGGGGELGFEIDLASIWPNPVGLGYTFGLEGGLMINSMKGENPENVSFYSVGGVLGLYYFPLSRLFTRVDFSLGVYQAAREERRSDPGLLWRIGGEAGFRFTPGFTIAANTGWRQYSRSEIRNSALYAGLTAQFTFQTGKGTRREGVNAILEQSEAVYPAFMQLYQSYPIGTVTVSNNENAEIRDVRLSFRASGYTASEFPCGAASLIPRGRNVELPLLADFSPDILLFTDSGRIMGDLVICYRFLGQERETVRAVTVATHNRNTITIGDASALAAFISPTSPETLDYAKYIAGLSRANRRTGHNQNMQHAIWLLEGLRASNIHLGKTYTDETEAQFPSETLSFRTGSNRDLALLFASGLEGVGIQSAFIQTADDFLVAMNLEVSQSASETLFSDSKKILVIDNNVWLPLSMSAFNEGFMACWTQGVGILQRAIAAEGSVNFVMVDDAWASYPPAPLPALGRNVVRTDMEAATREVNRVMQSYIDQEITPLIRKVSGEQGAAGNAASQNRLGILYARAGRTAEAKAAYERAAGLGSVPAMTNRGNLALSEKDNVTAERWFRQALNRDSQNSVALRGLEKIAGNR